MFIIVFLISCVSEHNPIAVVEVDYEETEFVYISQGYTGIIVAAPFENDIF
jgi:hypothetical protein